MRDHELLKWINDKLVNGEKLTVTVDYSCLDKVQQPDMSAIWSWNREGIIEITGTIELATEFDKASPGVREKLKDQYLPLDKLKPSPGAVFGECMFDEVVFDEPPTMREGKGVSHYFSEFRRLMFPAGLRNENDFHDVMHISIHYLFSRDVFLTRNLRHFNPRRLRERFKDLVVLTPEQLLDLLDSALGTRS